MAPPSQRPCCVTAGCPWEPRARGDPALPDVSLQGGTVGHHCSVAGHSALLLWPRSSRSGTIRRPGVCHCRCSVTGEPELSYVQSPPTPSVPFIFLSLVTPHTHKGTSLTPRPKGETHAAELGPWTQAAGRGWRGADPAGPARVPSGGARHAPSHSCRGSPMCTRSPLGLL